MSSSDENDSLLGLRACHLPDQEGSDISYTGVAQMDNAEVTDFEATSSKDMKATTMFIEATVEETGVSSLNTHTVSTYIENNADIKSFLERPVLLANGSWTTSQSNNTNLASSSIATNLTSTTMWADKIRGFNLIRGDFMIKVQLNGNPFHQGKLLLHYLPCEANFEANNAKYGKFKNKHLTQKIQHPHIEVDVRKTSAIMRIPYVAPTPWYALKEGYYDWGTWYLDVFSALKTGASAPSTEMYVDYLVYGWWENVELNAPTVAQSSNKSVMKRRGGEVSETKENSGPIELGLRKVGRVANALSEVPVLKDFAPTIEWASNILANVASVFGWSKPREHDGQTNVYQQYFRYKGTCDGPDSSFPGGVTVLNKLDLIDYGSYTNEDEMSLAFLYSVPYYVGEFDWSGTAGQGTSLLSQKISPLSFLNTDSDTVSGHTANYEYHAPFTYLARMHKLWRGSIILTLKMIKTQMHSGRLQVTWIPCNLPDVTPSLTTSSFNKRTIIDVRTEEIVSLELPYLLYSDYAPTTPVSPTLAYSGQVDITVLNDLRAPESCSQDIAVQYFFSPGKDFELVGPTQLSAGCAPYVPQSNGSELLRTSINQGMTLGTMEIGSKNTTIDPLFHAKRCVGEKIMSIKSYLLRNSVIQSSKQATFDPSSHSHLLIDPYFIGCCQLDSSAGTINSSAWVGDIFSLLTPMYAFIRGGIKLTWYDGAGTNRYTSNVLLPNSSFFGIQPYSTSIGAYASYYSIGIADVTQSSGMYPITACNINDNGSYVYQHIPYYNRLPMTLTNYYNNIDTPTNDPGRPLSTMYIASSNDLTGPLLFERSVAEDFQATFFTGAPCLLTSYS